MSFRQARQAAKRAGICAAALAVVWTRPASAQLPQPPPEATGLPVVLLVDLGSGQELLAREADRGFLPASMTKVMTAYVAFEEIARGRLRPDRRMVVREATAREWSGKGTSMYLLPGEEVSVHDLLRGVMTASANDASVVLAEGHTGTVKGWTFLMNDAARRLGMKASHFANPSGWPDGGHTHITARDLVRLAAAMIRQYSSDYARYSGKPSFTWRERVLYSQDPVSGVVKGADGIKTGYSREAGYNFLGSAMRDGRRLVMIAGGAASENQRAMASRALLEWGFAEWRARPLFRAGEPIATARVQGGAASAVALAAQGPVHATLPRSGSSTISLSIAYNGPIKAPIAKGQVVGELKIRVGDLPAGRILLVAAHPVGKGGPMDRLVNGFKNLFS
ncbi:MAG: D-alanyl-D-alanine carboxypeptidase [Alphaproteobacteria bacterium]|nr:D-alanyl-D-alanine carboxypeptidase [Alphaproteobacteria bacterium]